MRAGRKNKNSGKKSGLLSIFTKPDVPKKEPVKVMEVPPSVGPTAGSIPSKLGTGKRVAERNEKKRGGMRLRKMHNKISMRRKKKIMRRTCTISVEIGATIRVGDATAITPGRRRRTEEEGWSVHEDEI
jgi:hypothetical protein